MKTKKPCDVSISLTAKVKIKPSVRQCFNIKKSDIKAKIVSISVDGIGLLSKFSLSSGIIIDLEFMVLKKPIAVKGQVRSAVLQSNGLIRIGIKFLRMCKEQKQLIAAFMKAHERRLDSRFIIQS